MTGPDHYREAERLTTQADRVLDADYGWMASLSTEERLARRNSDLAAAQVHATLALTAATALLSTMAAAGYTDDPDLKAWVQAAGEPNPVEPGGDA
jgi:hypothetical protein